MKLGVLSDLHCAIDFERREQFHNRLDFEGVEDRIRLAAALFVAESVDAILVLGDLTHAGDPASIAAAAAALAVAERPVLGVLGNHDRILGDDCVELARGRCGLQVLESAGTRIDDVDVVGVTLASGAEPGSVHLADSSLEVRPWDSSFIVLASHYPVLSRRAALIERGMSYAGDLRGIDVLGAGVRRRGAPTLVLSGHLHVRDSHAVGLVLQLAAAALVEAPYEVAVVRVDRGTGDAIAVTRTAHALPGPAVAASRVPVLSPARETWLFSDGRWARTATGPHERTAPARARPLLVT